jgi:hypothetical protein
MMEPKSIFEELLYTTVRIEAVASDGSKNTGTGAILGCIREDRQYLFLTTGKGVIRDAVDGKVFCHRGREGKPVPGDVLAVTFSDFETLWMCHPGEDVDLAIMPFAPLLHQLSEDKVEIFFKAISYDLIPTDMHLKEELDAVEDVVFLGYPDDTFDRRSLLPIAKKCITATPTSVDHEGRPEFLVDTAVLPGSGGSPVFLWNIGTYFSKKRGVQHGSRMLFLGIVAPISAGKGGAADRIDISAQRVADLDSVRSAHFGRVIKSKAAKELIDRFLVEQGQQ